ncbi:MAG: hypothetical protein Q9187_008381, partial [Circinaria calcarea]
HTTPVSGTQNTADASAAAKERPPVTTFRSRRSTLCEPLYNEFRVPQKVDKDKLKADWAKIRPQNPGDLFRHDRNSEKDEARIPIRESGRGEDPAATTAKGNEKGGRKPIEGTIEAIGRFGDGRTKPTKRNVEATPTTKTTGKGGEASATRAHSLEDTVARARANLAPVKKTTTDGGSSQVSPFVQDIPEPPLIAAAKAASEKKKAEAAAEDGGVIRANATGRTRSATKPAPFPRLASAETAAKMRAAAAKGYPTASQRDGWDEYTNGDGVLIRRATIARNDDGRPHRRNMSLRGPTSYRTNRAPGAELIRQPGRQASLRAYWDHRRDGMWDVTWEGGLDHGFDVVICIIYIQLD